LAFFFPICCGTGSCFFLFCFVLLISTSSLVRGFFLASYLPNYASSNHFHLRSQFASHTTSEMYPVLSDMLRLCKQRDSFICLHAPISVRCNSSCSLIAQGSQLTCTVSQLSSNSSRGGEFSVPVLVSSALYSFCIVRSSSLFPYSSRLHFLKTGVLHWEGTTRRTTRDDAFLLRMRSFSFLAYLLFLPLSSTHVSHIHLPSPPSIAIHHQTIPQTLTTSHETTIAPNLRSQHNDKNPS